MAEPETSSLNAAPAQAGGPAAAGGELRDAAGRRIRYLRVSLTDRCNFRCLYCMPPEGVVKLPHEAMLRLEELARVVGVIVEDLGVSKVRVTGGEPLVRRGALDFLRALGALPGIADLALTTNGYLLAGLADEARRAGVRRVNISLDTLRPERFRRYTGVDGLARVLRGIDAATAAGFAPIKLNTVVFRDNLDEAAELLRFALARGLEIRFIELMPSQRALDDQFVSAEELRRALAEEFALTPAGAEGAGGQSGSARLYRLDGGRVCGFIAPVTEPFCASCDRLRLRGDGRLVPCLSSDEGFDVRPFARPDFRRRELIDYIRAAVGRSKGCAPGRRHIRAMYRIGG